MPIYSIPFKSVLATLQSWLRPSPGTSNVNEPNAQAQPKLESPYFLEVPVGQRSLRTEQLKLVFASLSGFTRDMEMVQQPLLWASTKPFWILPSFLRPSLPELLSPPLLLTCTALPSLSSSNTHRRRLLPPPALTDDEVAVGRETMLDESEFIEVGYISNAHGLHGEFRVKSATGFPELRFFNWTRWLRTQVSGEKIIREVELIEGRGHSGQKGWIVSFDGIDTVDVAKQYVGSTLLVK